MKSNLNCNSNLYLVLPFRNIIFIFLHMYYFKLHLLGLLYLHIYTTIYFSHWEITFLCHEIHDLILQIPLNCFIFILPLKWKCLSILTLLIIKFLSVVLFNHSFLGEHFCKCYSVSITFNNVIMYSFGYCSLFHKMLVNIFVLMFH